ncbi:unnamed protein product [Trifolium pratense]|uniref:Uncharacterized protein n=2 Tax=Trifolium pratense TaxID=57577 RepID=A0ACB0K6S1_TRIPR|nr:unnamed protein product [Trifolium pratense]CAJ2652920.1 unnamed protein product [Trifolium pratense]
MASIVGNTKLFSNIEEINSDKATWNFKAKIIRLWHVSDFNRPNSPFSVEMVLMDDKGGRIHATIKKTLIYKFKDELKEGMVYCFENMDVSTNGGAYRTTHHRYKLNFQFSSLVQRLSNFNIGGSPFNLVDIADVVSGSYAFIPNNYFKTRINANQERIYMCLPSIYQQLFKPFGFQQAWMVNRR